ncbi:ribonuclease H-like domain-containing protein [Gudongella sp. DL1XJH-153]|uniref:ribonuclease H-like domain-containing protein n=1 Tax=Gudongella sp. DL1XJH-153 TaxID=3409804 RepID=UPI003BB72210
MKLLKSIMDIRLDFNPLIPIDDICFFDIETTGLSRDYHNVYLIGLLFNNKTNNSWTLIQLFADYIEEEERILLEFVDRVKDFQKLVSYNGDSFDIPFVKKRLHKYGHNWENVESVDLYKYLRENKSLIDIPNLKLKTVEKYLGIERIDFLTGKECINLYKSYVNNNSDHLLKAILQHNYDDLQYMPHLLKLYNLLEDEKTVRIESADPNVILHIDNIAFIGNNLVITGKYEPSFSIPWMYYQPFYTINMNSENAFNLTVEIKKARLSDDILADIADIRLIANNNIKTDLSPYDTPKGILVLRTGNNIYIKNIKAIVENLFLTHYNNRQ